MKFFDALVDVNLILHQVYNVCFLYPVREAAQEEEQVINLFMIFDDFKALICGQLKRYDGVMEYVSLRFKRASWIDWLRMLLD